MPKKATEAVLTVKVNVDSSEISELSKEIKASYDEINNYSKDINIKTKSTFQNLIKTLKKEYANIDFSGINKNLSNKLSVATDATDIESQIDGYISSVNKFQSYLKDNNLSQKLFDGVDKKNIEQYIALVNKLNDSLSDAERTDINSRLSSFNDKLLLRQKKYYEEYNDLTRGHGIESLISQMKLLATKILKQSKNGESFDLSAYKKYVQYWKKIQEIKESISEDSYQILTSPSLEDDYDFISEHFKEIEILSNNSTAAKKWLSEFNESTPFFDRIENILSSKQKIEIDIDEHSEQIIKKKLNELFGREDIDLTRTQFHSSKNKLDSTKESSSVDNLGGMIDRLLSGGYDADNKYEIGFGTTSGTALYLQANLGESKRGDTPKTSKYHNYLIDTSKLKNSNLFRPRSEEDALSFSRNQADLQAYIIDAVYKSLSKTGKLGYNDKQNWEFLKNGLELSGSPNVDTLFNNLKKSYYGDFITKNEFKQFVSDYIQQYKKYFELDKAANKQENRTPELLEELKTIRTADNPTAALNKMLGYNGVDVSGYTALDNYRFGSGIYKLDDEAIVSEVGSITNLSNALHELWNTIIALEDTNVAKWAKENIPAFQSTEFTFPLSGDELESFNDELNQISHIESSDNNSKSEKSDDKEPTGKAKLEPELSETFKEDAEKLIDELGLEAKVTLSPVLSDDYSDKVADLIKESKDKNSTSADESTVEVESGENPQDKSNTTIELKPELIETFKTDAESAVAQLDIESPITLYPHVSDDFESDAMNSMPDLTLSVELTSKENSNEEDKSEDSFKQVELTPKLSGTFSDDAKQLVDELSPQADITLNPALAGDFADRAQEKVNDYDVGVYVDIYPRVNEGFDVDTQASADKVLTSEATTKSEQDTNTAQLTPKLSDNFKQVATDKINDLGIEGNAILVPVIPSNFNTLATNRVEATKPSAPIDIYPNLSADFESNINNAIDKLNLSGEESSFAKIGNSINDIIELVKQKNALIENEEEIVSRASTSEYKDFRAIADSISSVVFYLEELDKLMSNLDKLQGLTDKLKSIKFTKATSGNIENFATELEKLGDKLKDFGEKTKSIDLSHIDTISSNLNSLPSGKTFSKNLHELGDALSEFGKVLEDFNLNGGKSSPIITQISDLLSHSRELENLAKILNNYKKIKNVSSAVNGTDTLDDLYKQKSSKIKAISSLESKKQYNNLDRNSRIDEEIAYYENEIYDLDKKITNTVDGSQKLAAYNDEKKKELSYLEEELRLKRDLTAIDKRQRQSERSISDSKAEVDSYYNQITEKLKLIKSTMSKKKSTSGDDEIIDKFNSELDNRIEQYEKELETLKKEFSSKIESDTDWADLSSYISEKQKAIQLLEEEISLYKERKAKIQQSAEARREDNAVLKESADYYKKIESFQDFYQKKTSKKSFSLMSSDELDILKKYKSILDKIAEYRTKGWEDGSSWKDDILTDTQMSNLDYAISRMKDLKAQYESLSVYEKGTGDTKIEKFLNKVYTFMGNNTKAAKLFRTELESLIGTAKAAGKDVNLDNLMDQFLKIENAASSSGLMGNSFLDDFKKQANYTLSNFLAQYLSIQDVIRYAQSAISTIEDLDYALLDLSKTAAMTESQLNDFYFSANDSAKALGVTTEEIIDLASSWSRLGYNTNEEATKMAEMTAKFAAISPGTSTDEAQTGLINIMKAWNLQADQMDDVIDKVNVLGNSFALENQSVLDGMQKAASALSVMGTDYQDAFALFTGAQEVLQDADRVGNGLKTVAMRVRGYSEDVETGAYEIDDSLKTISGDLVDLTKIEGTLPEGISIYTDDTKYLDDANKKYKSLVDYFRELSQYWDQYSETTQTKLLQTLFGKTQAND